VPLPQVFLQQVKRVLVRPLLVLAAEKKWVSCHG